MPTFSNISVVNQNLISAINSNKLSDINSILSTTASSASASVVNNAGTTYSNPIISQQSSSNDNGSNTISQSITPGIVNIFPPTLVPDPISISLPLDKGVQDEFVSGMGFIPTVWYNAYQIETNDIDFLDIFNDGVSPCLKLIFIDSLNLLKDKAFPLDDTKIKVFLSSRSQQLKSLFIEFKIATFQNINGKMIIEGTINANNLYLKQFTSYSNLTSFNALQQVCKNIGFGFNTNIDNTTDAMTWINTGSRVYDFMEYIIDVGYSSDSSFLVGYIDFFYNFNYIDVQKELLRDIDGELGIGGAHGLQEAIGQKRTDETLQNLILSNDMSMNSSNCYFYSYRITNNSTATSLTTGYVAKTKYYDRISKSFLTFDIDSLNNNVDSSIILKGAPQDETFYNNNIDHQYLGKLDSDNMHKNYKYSYQQNKKNFDDLFKIEMQIEMGNPNYNIYKYQKIKIFMSSNVATPSDGIINYRLTGDWIIKDISFSLRMSSLVQIITLAKRELELSPDELANEGPQTIKKEANSQRYANPEPSIATTGTSLNTGSTAATASTISYPSVRGLHSEIINEIYPIVSSWVSNGINGNIKSPTPSYTFTSAMAIFVLAHAQVEGYTKNNTARRDKNPGNYRGSQYKIGQDTSSGGPKGYAIFACLQDGILEMSNAWHRIIEGRSPIYTQGSNTTLSAYIQHYAPSGDANDPTSYARTIASIFKDFGLNVTVDMTISQIIAIDQQVAWTPKGSSTSLSFA